LFSGSTNTPILSAFLAKSEKLFSLAKQGFSVLGLGLANIKPNMSAPLRKDIVICSGLDNPHILILRLMKCSK
jgi:hypothetical protein